MTRFYKQFLLPAGLLTGTIIGAGVFALPYVFEQAGLVSGFLYLAIGTLLYLLLHLLYADTILRTSGDHRFVGYARLYLGKGAGRLAILMTSVGMIFTLTIYLVLSISFIDLLVGSGHATAKLLLFWFLGSSAVFFKLKKLAFSEFIVTCGILVIIGVLFMLGLSPFLAAGDNLLFGGSFTSLFLPLAPVLFALSGRVAIPSLIAYFRALRDGHDYRHMRAAISAGTLVPAFVYALFVVGVIGLSGNVTEDAVGGLRAVLSPAILRGVGLLGLLSLWSSYVAVGVDTLASFSHDLRLPPMLRLLAVIGGPPVLYFLGFTSFFKLVSFVGGVFLGLEGIFILLMWWKARRVGVSPLKVYLHPVTLGFCLLLLVAAIVYEVIYYALS